MTNFRRTETQSRQLNPRVNELNRGALLNCETLGNGAGSLDPGPTFFR